MITASLQVLDKELDHWRDAGIRPSIWWRDDDAISVTPQLTKLTELSKRSHIPIMLAVIPASAEIELAEFVEKEELLSGATHGFAHQNHSDPDNKKTELTENAIGRSVKDVMEELQSARKKIELLFGSEASQVLVPPWNRISNSVLPHLGAIGFKLLSTFTDKNLGSPIYQINCHIDLMHWRPSRMGKTIDEALSELTACLQTRRNFENPESPIGVLSHHLVHDKHAWLTIRSLMQTIAERDIFNILTPDTLLTKQN